MFLFFAAHFIASNVIGLELAYEHRNHFALIGAVLAVGSVLMQLGAHLQLRPAALGSQLNFSYDLKSVGLSIWPSFPFPRWSCIMRANHVRMVCLEDVSCAQNDIANYLE